MGRNGNTNSHRETSTLPLQAHTLSNTFKSPELTSQIEKRVASPATVENPTFGLDSGRTFGELSVSADSPSPRLVSACTRAIFSEFYIEATNGSGTPRQS